MFNEKILSAMTNSVVPKLCVLILFGFMTHLCYGQNDSDVSTYHLKDLEYNFPIVSWFANN